MKKIDLEFEPPIATGISHTTPNAFLKGFNDRSLILRPAFQRNMVWNHAQKSFLVDSILRGLPVPEIYIQSSVAADGDETLIVVDGQQRITTCLAFLLGELQLSNSEELDPRWRGKKFADLNEALRQRFRGFKLVVRDLPELDLPTLREVFRRLNQTVESLEAQELRHAAYTGPFVNLIERFAAQPALRDLAVFSPKDYLRRRNDELIAEVCFSIVAGAYPNKKEGLDEFFLSLEDEKEAASILPDLTRRLGRVLKQLDEWSGILRRTRFKNKSDLYTLMILLAKRAEYLPLSKPISDTLVGSIRQFSELVNDLKRAEIAEELTHSEEEPEQSHIRATRYLRAVERAASDRLSRVRREENLAFVIDEVLIDQPFSPLIESDETWLETLLPEESEADDATTLEERIRAQRVLSEIS